MTEGKIIPVRRLEPVFTQKCNLNCTYCFEKCKDHADMDFNEYIELLRNNNFSLPSDEYYMFGGEPLMNKEFLERFIKYVESCQYWTEEEKKSILDTIKSGLTTNGTLIDKYFDFLLSNGVSLQVSLDGPKDINDACRIDFNGNGHFDHIMENFNKFTESGGNAVCHGALAKTNYSKLKDIALFFLETNSYRKEILAKPIDDITDDELFRFMHHNSYMTVIEDDITDEDIDTYLTAFAEACEAIMTTDLLEPLDKRQRKVVLRGFLTYMGSTCGAGNYILALDSNYNTFPCHREMTQTDRALALYNVKDSKFINYPLYSAYQFCGRQKFASGEGISVTRSNDCVFPHLNICFATNYLVTGELSHMPPKYTELFKELKEFVNAIAKYYGIDLRDSTNCSCGGNC